VLFRSDSDLADLVRAHSCGWVVEPGDIAGLRAALAEIASDPVGLEEKRQRAFAAGHAHYDMRPVAAEWEKLLGSLP
jgi:glycosyltransferase involved in cell wall biosynthesis